MEHHEDGDIVCEYAYNSLPVNTTLSNLKKQEGGDHYKVLKIQPVEYINANNIPFLEGNVIKYVTRHRDKNGKEDILKAIHYLEMILDTRYGVARG